MRDANGNPGIPREQLGTLRCRKCGSQEFEQLPRARLLYDRLNPQAIALEASIAFRCAGCRERLNVAERLAEIREAGRTLRRLGEPGEL